MNIVCDPIPLATLAEVLNCRDGERLARVLHMRYCGDRALTYREIGESIGVSLERARQLVNKGIMRLRHPQRQQAALHHLTSESTLCLQIASSSWDSWRGNTVARGRCVAYDDSQDEIYEEP